MTTECKKTKEELIFQASVEIYKSKGFFSPIILAESVDEATKIYELCFSEKEEDNKIKSILKD
jgi:hypothetical protein